MLGTPWKTSMWALRTGRNKRSETIKFLELDEGCFWNSKLGPVAQAGPIPSFLKAGNFTGEDAQSREQDGILGIWATPSSIVFRLICYNPRFTHHLWSLNYSNKGRHNLRLAHQRELVFSGELLIPCCKHSRFSCHRNINMLIQSTTSSRPTTIGVIRLM